MKYNVIGAGIAGLTFARLKAEQGHEVTVWEWANQIGGNLRDELDPTGTYYVHKFGPHLFHTNSSRVMEFLSQFAYWVPYQHRVVGTSWKHDAMGIRFPIPYGPASAVLTLNRSVTEIEATFKDLRDWFQKRRITLGELNKIENPTQIVSDIQWFVTNKVFANYSNKMWGTERLSDVPVEALYRVPIALDYDDRYFTDQYQCMPLHGYSNMLQRMAHHPNISLRFGVQVDDVMVEEMERDSLVFNTTPIDAFFRRKFGELPYRGLEFRFENTPSIQSRFGAASTINLNDDPKYTRVTSMASIHSRSVAMHTNAPFNTTDVLVYETPVPGYPGNQFYPVPSLENQQLRSKYDDLLNERPNLRFGGRLGSYQYLNMDQAVAQAMSIANTF